MEPMGNRGAAPCADLRATFALTRRGLCQFGGVSLLSGGLLNLLATRAGAGPEAPRKKARAKACILLFQVGGPYQCDTFDPKPNAPEEMRGPYRIARTRVPGVDVTEALPLLAQHADKFAIVRSVNHLIRCHNPAIYCSLVGREATEPMAVSNRTAAKRTDHPHYASVVARLQGARGGMPHHVILPDVVFNGPAKSPGLLAGYLGAAYDPFILAADPNAEGFRVDGVGLPADVSRDRLDGRRTLLNRYDAMCRVVERAETVAALGSFQQKTFELLTSSRTRDAFDLAREPARLRDRYGRNTNGQGTLLARRLVEAGVPFVTVFSHTVVEKKSWDTHLMHDELSKSELLPQADQTFSALLDDLGQRGLLDQTLVVWLGEFGRTPRRGIQFSNNTNNKTGRDHWCNCYSVVLAGGGVQGGRVIGSSDFIGAYPKERPVHVSDLAATIYHALGVDPRAQLSDIQGQLRFICDGEPVRELF
jgi:uncharacterized protein (DUF1501 family)